MSHRILPPRSVPQRIGPSRTVFIIGALGILVVLALIVFTARLTSEMLTGRANNASVTTAVNVTNTTPVDCAFLLESGTRLASFPCLRIEVTRSQLFSNLSGGGRRVAAMYRYVPSRASRWEVYNATLPNYTIQTLNRFSRFDALYLVMNGTELFQTRGLLPRPTRVTLASGWNLVGYAKNETDSIDQALSSINGSYTIVHSLNGSEETGEYLTFIPGVGGTLTNMTLHAGYWINTTSSISWVVS